MKLSEAISLGAMLSPQAFGFLEDAQGGRCALGAARAATGDSTNYAEWKWAFRASVNCPECGQIQLAVSAIAHLNDSHEWARQRIADWVSTVEPTEETSSNGEEFSSVA